MINTVSILGRVVNKPILKETGYGMNYLPLYISMRQATMDFHIFGKNKTVMFIVNCCAFDEVALKLSKVVEKGTVIAVTGKLGSMHWYNKKDELQNNLTVVVDKYVIIQPNKLPNGEIELTFGEIQRKKLEYKEKDFLDGVEIPK